MNAKFLLGLTITLIYAFQNFKQLLEIFLKDFNTDHSFNLNTKFKILIALFYQMRS